MVPNVIPLNDSKSGQFFIMKELIKISKSDKLQSDIVDARELYNFLEVKTPFHLWIERYINDFGFMENKDYCSFEQKSTKPKGGRPSKEYAIKIDMAKELSMLQRTEKGKQARLYFIECEKKLRKIHSDIQIPTSFAEALRLAAAQQEQLEKQQKQLRANEPKIETYDTFLNAENYVAIGVVAKQLSTNKNPMGQNRLFEFLRNQNVFISNGSMKNTPYQSYLEKGYFVVKTNPIKMGDVINNVNQTLVTPEGIKFIEKLWKKYIDK